MQSSRLFKVLRTLSLLEQEQFSLFLASPYFNTHQRLEALWTHLKPFAPGFAHPALSPEKIFSVLFPGKAFNAQRMRDDISLLYRLLKEFLAHQRLKNEKFQQGLWLLEYLQEAEEEQAFQPEFNALQRSLEQAGQDSGEQYHNRFLLADQANEFYGRQMVRRADFSLQDKLDQLDRYYFALRLRETCEALNRQHILNIDYRLPLLDELERLLDHAENDYLQTPLIRAYHAIFRCLRAPEVPVHFEQLVQLLKENREQIERQELRALYKHAQNYCIRKINQGQEQYQQRLFGLYQELLQDDLILIQGELAHTDYKNIVTLALRLQAYEWVAAFLQDYHEKIHATHRENAYAYCLAAYHAETGQHREAIRQLQSVTFTDALYDLSARHLLARIYFEALDWEALLYHLNAFNLFLRRSSAFSSENKASHLNFVRLLKALTELQERQAYTDAEDWEKRRTRLRQRIGATEALAYREWLLEQV